MEEESPRAFFSTNYHQVFRKNVFDDLPISVKQMAVAASPSDLSCQLQFLYQVSEGPSLNSFSIQNARFAGISHDICVRAQALSNDILEFNVSFCPNNDSQEGNGKSRHGPSRD